MALLPFITPPVPMQKRLLGNAKVGELEVEVRGGLTVGESAMISELLADEQNAFVKGAQIADAIAKEEGISLTEAFQIIESAISGRSLEVDADAIRLRHAERIAEVGRIYAKAGQITQEVTVTALVRSRCNLPHWGLEETRQMAKPLFDAFWTLAQDEQAAEDLPSSQPSEDDLKKPQPAKHEKTPRTGRRSSGS
jgi:hypothetical protein